MKKIGLKKACILSAALIMTFAMLAGCSGKISPKGEDFGASKGVLPRKESNVAGTLLLSVNPEIKIEYDKEGLVLEITGVNEDGKKILLGLQDYIGKDTQTVVNELVGKIYDAGYFNQTLQGHSKNIVLKIDDDSLYPGDNFLENLAKGVREAIINRGIDSGAVTIRKEDLDAHGLIGKEKAKELLLTQLGLSEASFRQTEYELDDGVYEFEFSAGGIKYQYEVDGRTGKILEADIEGNDDWDDLVGKNDDGWYDDDRYDDDRYDDDPYDDRYDDDRYDDDRYDHWQVNHPTAPSNQTTAATGPAPTSVYYYDDDRYDDDRYDDDRYDDDRYDDDRYDDDRYDDDRDDD